MMQLHGLDTDTQVFFYEQDFYVLSNFSAFAVEWSGFTFPTSEHLYHWLRFVTSEHRDGLAIAGKIAKARSAHDAFKIAQENKPLQRSDWDAFKVVTMKQVLMAKVTQHEYVRRKLLATGERTLIENSWRDNYWGWGENHDGKNMLGQCWMEIRSELRQRQAETALTEIHAILDREIEGAKQTLAMNLTPAARQSADSWLNAAKGIQIAIKKVWPRQETASQ